ncbi:lipoate--protein ligase [Rhodococcus ruber Chol-4]|uniref:Octanoyltransferase n=1 Tax=Rhodococcus ruber TaxID=1830 RepID=A0A098BTT0_9NOCA|nr:MULTISPECIES: lipoyl(octanoyl) transferase LipB [Rhodococcus]MDO2381191.1 lipoyl(octanoyl) transferase LipB [Rhodococcus ruber]NGR06032.1 lipoyl(octanoyl) transferase LipB [bacterium SGD-2]RIK10547.1 MAG: lipoyl(octanoyl) transferase LipB [Acidobacteriota bacterium]ATQ28195.1 lipoate-protein ligase B [Rhodococcus ruber]AUM17145.1 lipoate-protein ligase B [Rhodococcus ruber]
MSSASSSARFDSEPVAVAHLGLIGYLEAWERQREIAADRAEGRGVDTLLLLEHPPVYTAGKRTDPEDRPTDGTPVIDVDRGGKITWHGPGQLVGYPIIRLGEPIDVVGYVRRLEQALIEVCTDLGLTCGRVEGRSGVWLPAELRDGHWLPERKVAAIGVRVQRGVTMHGFSLNCDATLDAFDSIVPCGIRDAGVTSLTGELGRDVTVAEVMPAVTAAVIDALDGRLPVTDHDIERVTFEQAVGAEPPQTPRPEFTTVRYG